MAKRSYSDIEKANALLSLDANKGNVFKTALELAIPRKTLETWSKNRSGTNSSVANMRQENRLDLSDKFESIAHQYLSHASDPYVLASLTGKDAVFSAAIATDKMRLLRELPTSITEHVNSDSITVVLQSVLNELTLTD